MERGNDSGSVQLDNLEKCNKSFLEKIGSFIRQMSYRSNMQFTVCKNSNCQNRSIDSVGGYCSPMCQAKDYTQLLPSFSDAGYFAGNGNRQEPLTNGRCPPQQGPIPCNVTRPQRNNFVELFQDNYIPPISSIFSINSMLPKVYDGNVSSRPTSVFRPQGMKSQTQYINDDDDIQISCQFCFNFTSPNKNNCDSCGAILRKRNGGDINPDQPTKDCTQLNCAPTNLTSLDWSLPHLQPLPQLTPTSCWLSPQPPSNLELPQLPQAVSKDNWSFNKLTSTIVSDKSLIACPSCSFMNGSFLIRCLMCDANLEPLNLNNTGEFLYDGVEIQCSSCCSFNDPRNDQCKICSTSLKLIPTLSEFTSPSKNLDSETPDLIIMTKCLFCACLNDSRYKRCEFCFNNLSQPLDSQQQNDCNTASTVKGGAPVTGVNIVEEQASVPRSPSSRKKRSIKTQMIVLSEPSQEYIAIKQLFSNGLPRSRILAIIRLQMPNKLVAAHENYKKEIALQCASPTQNNTYRMFHGTKVSCDPQRFIDGNISFCKTGCGLCGIAQSGNQRRYSRFNGRMWFANSSQISLGYCRSFNKYARFFKNVMGMFVVDVVSSTPGNIIIVDKNKASYASKIPNIIRVSA
ncbi:11019_t:CDS:2 [Acaulospora morrowiae]|uniref:11019_t:CDS:1 n=1 Tax=Acaulospora morrowiae TaxID=94023 RepID=A0A9N9GES3_9GLOM|nr:11019_t:CDS:2 [Acaulospora morrowiae]